MTEYHNEQDKCPESIIDSNFCIFGKQYSIYFNCTLHPHCKCPFAWSNDLYERKEDDRI